MAVSWGDTLLGFPMQATKALANGPHAYAGLARPFGYRQGLTERSYGSAGPSIVGLLLISGPTQVSRFVSAIVVYAVQLMSWWTWSKRLLDPLYKRLNGLHPSWVHAYSAAAIVGKAFTRRIGASATHQAPGHIERMLTKSVLPLAGPHRPDSAISASKDIAVFGIEDSRLDCRPARTPEQPQCRSAASTSFDSVSGESDWGELAGGVRFKHLAHAKSMRHDQPVKEVCHR